MDETPPNETIATPSLLHQLRGLRLPNGTWLRILGMVIMAGLALAAIVAGVLGRQARHAAIALGDRAQASARERQADQAGAALFGSATIAENMAELANHLPPGARLALAARDQAGAVTIAIDSADPDALRHTLRADPWFAAFHERGQTASEDGAIRVTFERGA